MKRKSLLDHFEWQNNPPLPFNPEARGDEYGKTVSREYAVFCDAHSLPSKHPDLVAAYAEITTRVAIKFPTWGECQADSTKVWNPKPTRGQRDAAYRARKLQNVQK